MLKISINSDSLGRRSPADMPRSTTQSLIASATRSGLLQHRADLPAAELAALVTLMRRRYPKLVVRSAPAARLFRQVDLLLPE